MKITDKLYSFKSTIQTIAVTMLLVFACACKKDAEPYVRVKNEYFEPVVLKLDAINFGKIGKGVTTDYKYVFPGSFPITITTESGLEGAGMVNLTGGGGRENWTLVITKDGGVYGTQSE